jgi:hypothetical protein
MRCTNTWKYNIPDDVETYMGPRGHILMDVICRPSVFIHVWKNSVEYTTL